MHPPSLSVSLLMVNNVESFTHLWGNVYSGIPHCLVVGCLSYHGNIGYMICKYFFQVLELLVLGSLSVQLKTSWNSEH